MSGHVPFSRYTQKYRITSCSLSDSCYLSSGSTHQKDSMWRQHRYGTSALVHTITNPWSSNIRRSHNLRQYVFLGCHRSLINQRFHVTSQVVVQRNQVGRTCRPSNRATTTYSLLPKSLVQMMSVRKWKMKWCAIVLKPYVSTRMQWYILQDPPMQYAFKES